MRMYLLLFAPVPLLVFMSPLVRRARRYVAVCALVAPAVVGVGLLVQWWYYPPTVEGSTAVDGVLALVVTLGAAIVAGWAAVIATVAATSARKWVDRCTHNRFVAACAAAGAVVGSAFPIGVVALFVGRAALEQFFWIGLYIPGAIAGAVCGALLPPLRPRPAPL